MSTEPEDLQEKDAYYENAKAYWSKVPSTVDGMLGGLQEVGFIGEFLTILVSFFYLRFVLDIQGSANFLKMLFKHRPAPGKTRALDCGAGIGRVSRNLLMNEFQFVDLVEQQEAFCEVARKSLSSSNHLGEVFAVGLQDFRGNGNTYDIVWSQWVLGHLKDDHLVDFFKRISGMLNKNGMIVVKENFTKDSEVIFDEQDSSVTRSLSLFKKLIKQTNLKIIKEERQTNFPKALFPVFMIAMRPIKQIK
jgi:protein N-terminal methyltransferase